MRRGFYLARQTQDFMPHLCDGLNEPGTNARFAAWWSQTGFWVSTPCRARKLSWALSGVLMKCHQLRDGLSSQKLLFSSG